MGNFLQYTFDYTLGHLFQSLTPNICLWSKYFSYFINSKNVFIHYNTLHIIRLCTRNNQGTSFLCWQRYLGQKYLEQFLFLLAKLKSDLT